MQRSFSPCQEVESTLTGFPLFNCSGILPHWPLCHSVSIVICLHLVISFQALSRPTTTLFTHVCAHICAASFYICVPMEARCVHMKHVFYALHLICKDSSTLSLKLAYLAGLAVQQVPGTLQPVPPEIQAPGFLTSVLLTECKSFCLYGKHVTVFTSSSQAFFH